ncbi:MAG: PAS domain S-box protein [Terriglobia bacterium]
MNSDPPIDERIRPQAMPRLLLLVFFILAVSIGAAGYYYYSNQRKQIRQSSAEELSAIAEMKASEIENWRKAHLGDAQVIFGGPWTAARIQQYLNDPSSNTLEQEILVWMESRRKNYQYSSVFLFDALGHIRLSANPGGERIQPLTIDLVKHALSTRQAILSDIQESNQGSDLDIDLIAPLVLKKGSEQVLVGVVLFRIDPRTSLYPLIQKWPTPSGSGETLLVRREGNDVLFLNELRHRKNTSLPLHIPLGRLEVPAVQAVLGQEGTMEGVDYRGVKVLAVSRQIADSSWWMISKVDLDEVYRPLHERAPWVIAFMGILIVSAASSLGFIWRHQTVHFYQKEYQAELARRLTEQKMKESEARYRSLFENMLEGYAYCRMIFEHDQPQDFIYLDVNRAFEQLTGLKNVVGKRVTEVIPGIRETSPELFEVYGRVALTGKPERFEIYLKTMGIWFSISVYSPQKECFVAAFENITERKRAERILRDSEERFRTSVENMLDGFAIFSAIRNKAGKITDFRYEYINDTGCQMNQRRREEHLGHTLLELYPANQAEGFFDEYVRCAETGRPLIRESVNYTDLFGEGRLLTFAFDIRAVKLGDGFAVVWRDATERKRAEEQLRSTSLYARSLLEASLDPLVTISPEGKITDVNQSTEQVTGVPRERLIGSDFSDYFTEPDEARKGYQEVISEGFVRDYPLTIRHAAGKTTDVLYNATLYRNEGGTIQGVFAVARDITARKHAEEEIRRLNAELEQRVLDRTTQLEAANKELEAFAYSVSHDLRAPLRAVDGFSRILLSDYAAHLDPEPRRYLQLLRENSQQMGHLIDDLLAFSRLSRQAVRKQTVELRDLINKSLEDLRHEQDVRHVTVKVGDLPSCLADPALLKQVFVNLLSNALKFTRTREWACIEIGFQNQNGRPVYFVRDNGVGFDMQYAEKLFGVFQRLHRAEEYEGTGVGLAIVQRIILRHGGQVWAESKVDQGATFYFYLEGEAGHE